MASMYGKFFGEDSDSSDDEQVDIVTRTEKKTTAFSSDSEDEARRVVRTAREKRFDEIQQVIYDMRNHKKINDIGQLAQDFDKLVKGFEKSKKIIDVEGVPKFYIRCLADLEKYVDEAWTNKKSFSKLMAKSLATLRPRLKKYNKNFEKELEDYIQNPENYPEEFAETKLDINEVETSRATKSEVGKDEEQDRVEDSEEDIKVAKKSKEKDLDDSDSWDEDESDYSSESEDDNELYKDNPALRFLKKDPSEEKQKDKKKKDAKAKALSAAQKKKKEAGSDDDFEEWTAVDSNVRAEKMIKAFDKPSVEITFAAALKRIQEIQLLRGRKTLSNASQLSVLEQIDDIIVANGLGLGLLIKVKLNILSLLLEHNSKAVSYLSVENWARCLQTLSSLIDIFQKNVSFEVNEEILEENECLEASPYKVRGCIPSVFGKIDDEFIKILQNTDPHGTEYVERLKDDAKLTDILEAYIAALLSSPCSPDDLCRMYLLRISHLYYRFEPPTETCEIGEKSSAYMMKMCCYVYNNDSQGRCKTRTILYHIYHLALHDNWQSARDLMAMSQLSASIDKAEIPTQILYNRAMVQLGLCAFRAGHIREAHQALADLEGSGHVKELLAQGIAPPARHDKTPEEIKYERLRQIPYHQHINLDLVECVYLVSAMLSEVHVCVAQFVDGKKKPISRNFHHVLKTSEKQTLTGPPDTPRDHVIVAAKALFRGDWRETVNNILNEKMNRKIWNQLHNCDQVKQDLKHKMQCEAVRTYLFGHSSIYEAISLPRLAQHFELGEEEVHQLISKMILNQELMGSLDDPRKCLIMHRTEPNRVQGWALKWAEKISQLSEMNEKLSDMLRMGTCAPIVSGTVNKVDDRQRGKMPTPFVGGKA